MGVADVEYVDKRRIVDAAYDLVLLELTGEDNASTRRLVSALRGEHLRALDLLVEWRAGFRELRAMIEAAKTDNDIEPQSLKVVE